MMKPGLWAVSPGAVDPAFQGLWSGLVFLAPLWGKDREQDLVTGQLTEGSGWQGSYFVGDLGYGRETDRTSGGTYEWATHPSYDRINAASGYTFAIVHYYFGTTSDPRPALLAIESATTRYGFYYGNVEEIEWWSASQTNAWNFVPTNDEPYLIVARWDGTNVDTEAWNLRTKAQESSLQVAEGTAIPAGEPIYIGSAPLDPGKIDGSYLLAGMWGRRLSDTELAQMVTDPFGMIRPALLEPGTIELWPSVDDDPASPTDTDWINNARAV